MNQDFLSMVEKYDHVIIDKQKSPLFQKLFTINSKYLPKFKVIPLSFPKVRINVS